MEIKHVDEQNETTTELTRTPEHSQVVVETAPARPKPPMYTGAKIHALIPGTFDEVWRIATIAVKSGLSPRDLNTPERASVAIMHGMELNLPPMMALQRIAVINGRPSVWGDAVPAIVFSTGQVIEFDEHFTGEEDTDVFTAVCKVARRMGNGIVLRKESTFSVADAKKADLWDERKKVTRRARDGSSYEKDNDSPWYRFPKRMLQMRARVALRDLFADAMCGLYIAEELVGRDSDPEMRDVTPMSREQIVHNPLGNGDDDERETSTSSFPGATGIVGTGGSVTSSAPRNGTRSEPRAEAAGEGKSEPVVDAPKTNGATQTPNAEGDGGKKRQTRRKTETQPNRPTDAEAAETGRSIGLGEQVDGQDRQPRQETPPAQVQEEEFPKPYIRQTPAIYYNYARRWIPSMPDQQAARERWTKERTIRSGLADKLDEDMLTSLQELMGKLPKPEAIV